MQTADRVLGRNLARDPTLGALGILDAHERQHHAVGIAEAQGRLAEHLDQRLLGDAPLDQAVGPPADGGAGDPEGGLLGLADPDPAGAARSTGKKVRMEPGRPAASP